jgi:TrmH family RNA methyltransferase
VITSNQNPKIKLVRALQGRPKERHKEGAFVVEGARLVEDAFAAKWRFRFALVGEVLSKRGRALVKQLESGGIDIEPVSQELMQYISETETPQGILAVVELLPVTIHNLDFILIPDSIHDPGNLGTLLRTAAAAGVQAVFIPPETVDPFAPKVVRAGMGAHFHLPIHLLPWEAIRLYLKRKKVFLADMTGERSCWDSDFRAPLALIIGGEAEGASEAARKLAHERIYIPMTGNMESLNAGAAGAILIFEVVRQRKEAAELREASAARSPR